jgi:4-hydroxybenzoyl-CoA thioesterase
MQGPPIYTHPFRVEWGDADPARIVFYPNYFRWVDAANHNAMESVGVDNNYLLDHGYVGFPITQANAAFKRPGLYGDRMRIEVRFSDFTQKAFRCLYRCVRTDTAADGATVDTVIFEAFEDRILAKPHATDPKRITPADIPDDIKRRLTGAPA